MAKNYWLMKTEPDLFSFNDLISSPGGTDHWDGIRNYQARNFLRDTFQVGDEAFIYHSRCDVPGIAGIAKVVKGGYPDHTALNPKSKYFDKKPLKDDEPRWYMVDVKATHHLKNFASLKDLREHLELSAMLLLKRGQRLSIQPVTKDEFSFIKKFYGTKKL